MVANASLSDGKLNLSREMQNDLGDLNGQFPDLGGLSEAPFCA